MQRRLFTLPDDIVKRLDKSINRSGEVRDALKFYWDFKDKGKAMMVNSDKLLSLVSTNKPTAPLKEDEIDDEYLAQARREHPELTIKRGDDWDLVYWEPRANKWLELYK